jgi:two-component system OmpR family sensor kinase
MRRYLPAGGRLGHGAGDLIAAGVPLVLLFCLSRSERLRDIVPLGQATVMAALLAVTAGGMAAILAHVVSRLIEDRRMAWLSVALTVYSLVALPAATIDGRLDDPRLAIDVARLFAQAIVVVLLVVAIRGPALPRCPRWWLSVAAVPLTVGVAGLGAAFPGVAAHLSFSGTAQAGLACAGPVAALLLASVGWATAAPTLSRLGVGFAVLMLVPPPRSGPGGDPADGPVAVVGLTESSVHLLGMLLVLVALVRAVRDAIRFVDSMQAEQEEELRVARLDLEQAKERDHELRNGLAGLAGAARVFQRPLAVAPGLLTVEEPATLGRAMAAELERLNSLLCGARAYAGNGGAEYAVLPVLRQQVALRRSLGMDIRLDAELGLVVKGSPAILAQVLTNVLTNCAKHAAGSPVRIQASRVWDTIRIRVSDFGPGLAPGMERTALEAEVRGDHSTGSGLGLHISNRLLQADGGCLLLDTSRASERGCTVVLELPAASARVTPPRPAAVAEGG